MLVIVPELSGLSVAQERDQIQAHASGRVDLKFMSQGVTPTSLRRAIAEYKIVNVPQSPDELPVSGRRRSKPLFDHLPDG